MNQEYLQKLVEEGGAEALQNYLGKKAQVFSPKE